MGNRVGLGGTGSDWGGRGQTGGGRGGLYEIQLFDFCIRLF